MTQSEVLISIEACFDTLFSLFLNCWWCLCFCYCCAVIAVVAAVINVVIVVLVILVVEKDVIIPVIADSRLSIFLLSFDCCYA